ncbi:GNAT family N-acetyltransferase [Candidatus Bipolaricaulota bacterium]
MEYRIARETDLNQLAELRWQFRTDEDGELPLHSRSKFTSACETSFREGLSSGTQAYWLAIENDVIVSHVTVQKVPMVPRPCKISDFFGYITNSYTLPNDGVKGSALMEYLIDWAHAEDLELLIVWPSDRAVPFYRRLGFDADSPLAPLGNEEE